WLFRRRIVPLTEVYGELRQARWRQQLDLQLSPVSVVLYVVRRIANHILVAQLRRNARSNVLQVREIVADSKEPAARHLADLLQQFRAENLFLGWRIAVEDTDGVNLHVALSDHTAKFAFRV